MHVFVCGHADVHRGMIKKNTLSLLLLAFLYRTGNFKLVPLNPMELPKSYVTFRFIEPRS